VTTATTVQVAAWEGRALLDGRRARLGGALREAVQRTLWDTAIRVWCSPFTVEGSPAAAPAVYVANHASHADTAAVRAAMGARARRKLAVAAADDYFFSTSRRAAAFTVAVGAFPFPRSGALGLRRADDLLSNGWSVLLYPQGTRSAGSEYRPGVLRLAAVGWPIIPVGIAGTDVVLPKGAQRPWRAPTAVVFGTALSHGVLRSSGGMDELVAGIEAVQARAQRLTRR
jgi:1-acyl-sn-glycerol-3-phosphate acyltransferase